MSGQLDPEIRVANMLLRALTPMDIKARRRVIDYLESRLALDTDGVLTRALEEIVKEVEALKTQNDVLKKENAELKKIQASKESGNDSNTAH
jgi:cell shape-determining protein MreC